MNYRQSYVRRKLLAGTSRWYQLHHVAHHPQIQKWAGIILGLGCIIFYFGFLFGMPSIKDIQVSFKESSIIYDREGNQLYTIYGGDENRQYVNYTDISPHMIHAIVAMEDQRFFSNIGFDIFGIVRSALTCSTGGICGGGSSLSQQLIKNTLLSNERTMKRKVREMILAFELNMRFPKEKILELYLNKISFGSNSAGVEQASRRFFGKSSRELNILEASILASLPKSPTAYNPYSHKDKLMGYVYYHDPKNLTDATVKIDNINNPGLFDKFQKAFSKINFTAQRGFVHVCGLEDFNLKNTFKKNSEQCTTLEKKSLIEFLNSLEFNGRVSQQESSVEQSVVLEYQAGRKDRVLMRMYEDNYINDSEYRESLQKGLMFIFEDPKESIKYPHFVFYVRDYLVARYGEEFFQQGGWKIYTTIDPKLQNKAEELINTYATTTFQKYGINNGALVALDSNNRDIVAMVGSMDYYNKEIDGEVNIMTSLKQPGSSMKPFIYARAFENNNLSTDTPIFDVEMDFGNYKPKNFDGSFLGPMTIRTALDASRNIPAIKMFFLATRGVGDTGAKQEYDLVEYLRNFGLDTIEHRSNNNLYGPPIALGSAEIRGIDFAAAYASLANNGQYLPPNPILKIFDPKGNEIVIDTPAFRQNLLPAAAYMITDILADNSARPEGWNHFLALANGRKAAVKTGTSSKKIGENTLPRDLWTVGYTPQYTAAVWTGNTDGKPASARASGMESSALIWKNFMDFAHTDLPKKDFLKPEDVVGNDKFLYINGKKPDVLSSFDPQKIEVDVLCNGKVDEKTPKEAIKQALLLETAFPIEDGYPGWRTPVDAWLGSEGGRTYLIKKLGITEDILTVVSRPEIVCERPKESSLQFTSSITDNMEVFSGLYPIEINYNSDHPLKEVQIIINDIFYRSVNLGEKKTGNIKAEFGISSVDGPIQTLTIRIVDTFGYSTSRNYTIKVLEKDQEKPVVMTENPATITLKRGQQMSFSGVVNDDSEVSKIQVFVNDLLYGTFQGVKKYHFTLKSPADLNVGNNTVIIQVSDFQKNLQTLNHTVIIE